MPERSYLHECGDGAYAALTYSGHSDESFPGSVMLPGECLLCGVSPVTYRLVTQDELAALDRDCNGRIEIGP